MRRRCRRGGQEEVEFRGLEEGDELGRSFAFSVTGLSTYIVGRQSLLVSTRDPMSTVLSGSVLFCVSFFSGERDQNSKSNVFSLNEGRSLNFYKGVGG